MTKNNKNSSRFFVTEHERLIKDLKMDTISFGKRVIGFKELEEIPATEELSALLDSCQQVN